MRTWREQMKTEAAGRRDFHKPSTEHRKNKLADRPTLTCFKTTIKYMTLTGEISCDLCKLTRPTVVGWLPVLLVTNGNMRIC